VSLSDGLIAAMVFFVTQAIAALIIGRNTGMVVLISFAIGGGLTYALMRWVYARAKTQGVPTILADANRPLLGVAAGVAAGLVAFGYLYVIDAMGILDTAMQDKRNFVNLGWWLMPLALIAAPLFEEFIFRGLIFGGLRRSFGVWPATLTSAAVFAIMHPALSIAPVFVLGVCAALVYERTRGLLAPMLTHAAYNACAIGAQFWLL
jgi:ABC-2 type transport system permease protein